jgi:hypothetical protein
MILTGPKLESIGRALYGEVWVSVLSKRLGRAKRTIMRWRDNQRALPKALQLSLIDLIDDRLAELGEYRGQLAETFDDA